MNTDINSIADIFKYVGPACVFCGFCALMIFSYKYFTINAIFRSLKRKGRFEKKWKILAYCTSIGTMIALAFFSEKPLWTCEACGTPNGDTFTCKNCGANRYHIVIDSYDIDDGTPWTCACGQQNNANAKKCVACLKDKPN